jgi:hypothetical protein
VNTRQIRREATANHLQRVAAAPEALARVAPYRPDLEPSYRGNTAAVYEQADEIIALLREGRAGWPRPEQPTGHAASALILPESPHGSPEH